MLSYDEWINLKMTEMATTRKDAMILVDALSTEIYKHLLKVLYWDAGQDYKKHIKDIDTWLFKIDTIKLKGNKRIPHKDLYEWLFDNVLSEEDTLKKYIKILSKDYETLNVIQPDVDKLNEKLISIYVKLTKDISEDNFVTINNYLKD